MSYVYGIPFILENVHIDIAIILIFHFTTFSVTRKCSILLHRVTNTIQCNLAEIPVCILVSALLIIIFQYYQKIEIQMSIKSVHS